MDGHERASADITGTVSYFRAAISAQCPTHTKKLAVELSKNPYKVNDVNFSYEGNSSVC